MKSISFWFIWKKAYRTLFNNKSKTIPIFILLTFAIGFGTVMYNIQDIRGKAIDEVINSTNFADGFVYFDPLPLTQVELLLNSETYSDLDDYEMRMILVIKFEISDKDYDGLLVGIDLSRKSHINSLIDKDKKEIDEYDLALNMAFAEENNIDKEDKLKISHGSIEKEIEVKEVGYNPEFQSFPLYKNVAFPSLKPFPILYVDIQFLNEHFLNQSSPLVNQLVFQFKSSADEEDMEESIEKSFGPYLEEYISQEDHPFIKSMREDEENDRILILILTGVFLAGAIITLMVVMHKLVEDDLKSVSVFQALGANKREILLSYLLFNVILIVLSICLGIFLSIFLNIPVNNLILEALNIPITLEAEISFFNPLWIGAILFLASIISTLFIVKKTFKMDVLQTLKYETKFLEKRGFIERIYTQTNKTLNSFTLYNIRRIFGRKMHLISLIIALSVSASLLIFLYSFQDSFNYSIDQKFNYVEQWDGVANTWQYENKSEMEFLFESLKNIDEFEFGISDAVLCSKKSNKNFDDTLRILAFEEKSNLHLLEIEEGRKNKKDKEVLVSKDILNKFSLRIGDYIYVKSIGSNVANKLIIVGTVNDLTEDTLFISIEKAQNILNKTSKINTIYFISDDLKDTTNDLLDLPQIEQVVKKKDIIDDVAYVMEMASTMFLVFGIIFFLFGLLLISIIFKSVIDYRIEDYTNMKAIGLYNYEVRRTLILEMSFYFLVAVLFGILFGLIIMDLIINMYSSTMPGLRFYIYPLSYLLYTLSFCFILILSFIYNYRRIKRINVAEIMRKKTFG